MYLLRYAVLITITESQGFLSFSHHRPKLVGWGGAVLNIYSRSSYFHLVVLLFLWALSGADVLEIALESQRSSQEHRLTEPLMVRSLSCLWSQAPRPSRKRKLRHLKCLLCRQSMACDQGQSPRELIGTTCLTARPAQRIQGGATQMVVISCDIRHLDFHFFTLLLFNLLWDWGSWSK